MIDIDDWFQSAIDDYELKNIPFENFGKKKKKIGRGGFGDIYSTTCKSIPSISAIPEVIALKGVSVGEEDSGMSIKRFLNELKLHSMAKNDRIIKFFGVSRDEDNDQYYLIIEFADGGDLRGYLTRNKNNIQWEEKLNLAIQITEGIAYIHNELNTAHRDLHTKNILIHKGSAKISDFGLSKCLDSTITTRSKIFGVIPFIEPQVFHDRRYKPDKKSDIYSLGVLFWEISSCCTPFRDVNHTTLGNEIFMGLREKPVPETPLEYVQIYSGCWETEPTQRFELNYIIDRLKTTSLTPVFEDPIIPESETPSDLYLKIDNNFASLSIITDLDISTNIRVQHVSSSINSKNYLKTTVKPIKISLPLRTIGELWLLNFFEKFYLFNLMILLLSSWFFNI
ncbi:kinase-like domain-containing protein [Gigaspora rosea]|uniref:Kinase-like domain-containing protein n=1 Tax=Gigaspora rosea TaxID=44941 RepID=A0A397VUD5_9GLOM|nr:kinase-like domain-containing protein [Gigaspora rosea]